VPVIGLAIMNSFIVVLLLMWVMYCFPSSSVLSRLGLMFSSAMT